MGLFDLIERQNDLIMAFDRAKKEGKVFIYGNGWGRENVEKVLQKYGRKSDGVLVGRKYFEEKEGLGCFEDYCEESREKFSIIIGIVYFDTTQLDSYREKLYSILYYDAFFPFENDITIDYPWFLDNYERINRVYSSLEDEFSKATLVGYINQRITLNYKWLKNVKSLDRQYFEKGIIDFGSKEYLVDCGAYDGDSASDFIEALEEQGIETYERIVSFEPDRENYQKMIGRGIKKHLCICKGVAARKQTLSFSSGQGTSSRFGDGEDLMEITTIDEELSNSPITMIKMDIEGFELQALMGAREAIKALHPKLAICVYHKKEDLFDIPEYIRAIDNSYRFYIRAYENRTTELVLYAV